MNTAATTRISAEKKSDRQKVWLIFFSAKIVYADDTLYTAMLSKILWNNFQL